MNNTKKIVIICSLLVVLVWCAAAPASEKNAAPAPGTNDILLESGNPVLRLMAASYSPRAFAPGEIHDRDIERILTCASKAPSGKNNQPWHFTVVKNYEKTGALTRLAKEGNVLIVVSGNRAIANMQFDCALATQNMQLAAQALGLGARILRDPVQEIETRQRAALGIPQGYDAVIAILIGRADSTVDAASSASPRGELASKVNYVR